MKVLIACEFSGKVRDAFRKIGHNAWSCDLISSESPLCTTQWHYELDIRKVLDLQDWDIMIAFPPCTYLCNSGVRWLHEEKHRWKRLDKAADLFWYLLHANINKIAIENPIPHKYAIERIGRKYDQIIQPWQFGHNETKATCLWLKNLPKLQPTNIVDGREAIIHKMGPSKNRAKLRSITYQGIANAMAEQWG